MMTKPVVILLAWTGLATLTVGGCSDDGPVEAVAPDPVPTIGADWQPAFSPDGDRIAFVSNRDGGNQIFLMGADGSDPVRLSRDTTALSNVNPAWAPDGRRIAYASFIGDNWEVALVNADGTGHTNLTRSPAPNSLPVWAPDGRTAYTEGAAGQRTIFTLEIDGERTDLTADSPFDDFNPVFSPDGRRIAFISNRDGRESLYLMAADGSNPTRLHEPMAADEYPSFAPDGRQLAFSSQIDGRDEVFAVNDDSTGLRQLTQDGGRRPIYAPDGRRIAFDRLGAVWVMQADGRDQRPLLADADGASAKTAAALHGTAPAVFSWSPDGRRIALTAYRDDPLGDIFVVEVESGRAFNLTPPAE